MGFSGSFRFPPSRRWSVARLAGVILAPVAFVTLPAAADDLQPPVSEAGPGLGDAIDPVADEQPPLPEPPEAGLPPPPSPPDQRGAPTPPFPDDAPGDGGTFRGGDATAPPAAFGVPPPGDESAPPAVEPAATSADGTMSVLVPPPSSPAGPAGGMAGASNPPLQAGLRPAPPVAAPPPSMAVQATTPPANQPPPSQAADLMARALELPFPLVAGSPTTDVTPPRPLTLLEALERSGDRTRRLWITQAYWKLAAAAARVRFAAESEERLSLVAPGENPDDLVLLDLETASARGESAAAGVDLVAAQQEIIDLVRLPVTEPPPWPVDRPLTAAYQTHFDTIFAARPATGRVRAIHRQLPLEYAALASRAEAVRAAERRFAAMEALHAKGSKPIGAVLSAHDAVVEQGDAFVGAVRVYNLDIAEYVMAVADLSVPDERFATMLIGQPTPWRQPPTPVPPFAGNDRVVPVAGQAFPVAQGVQSPDVFPAGTPVLQTPPAGLPGLPGGGGPGNGPGVPPRFASPPNPPAGQFPGASPPFGN